MDNLLLTFALVTTLLLVVMASCTTIAIKYIREGTDKNYRVLERLEKSLERVALATSAGGATGMRMEAHAGEVADNLAASIKRADDSHGPPGTAADSALSTACHDRVGK